MRKLVCSLSISFVENLLRFQQYKKYDKNSMTKNWESAKQYKKYDKTFVYLRVSRQCEKPTTQTAHLIFCRYKSHR